MILEELSRTGANLLKCPSAFGILRRDVREDAHTTSTRVNDYEEASCPRVQNLTSPLISAGTHRNFSRKLPNLTLVSSS